MIPRFEKMKFIDDVVKKEVANYYSLPIFADNETKLKFFEELEKKIENALMERSIRMFKKASYGTKVTLELMGEVVKVKKTPESVDLVQQWSLVQGLLTTV